MNPIAQAAVKAITKLRPNIQDGYLRQRAAEDASARLTIASPRCRIDDKVVATSEGAEIPIRVFTPLDIDFSLRNGLHVNEDFEGHDPFLPWRRIRQWRYRFLYRYVHEDGAQAQ